MSDISFSKNTLFNKNNFSNWIIGGIIALIITKLSDPISEFLFSNMLNIGGNFITRISNSTYKEISYGFSDQSSIVLFLIFLIVISLLLFIFMYFFDKYNNLNNKIEKLFASIDNPKNSLGANNNATSDDTHENDTGTLKKEIKKISKKNFLSFLFFRISFLFLTFTIAFIYGQSNFINNKIKVMTNNIEIVSPYITDAKYKQLKSKFHLIETQSDYNSLMNELKTIANKYSLKLK